MWELSPFAPARTAAAVCVVAAVGAAATPAEASTFSTTFGPNTPVGAQPEAVSDGGVVPDELAAITTFGGPNGVDSELFAGTPNLGENIFVANGPYYVAGNRSYGFAGPGRSDILFTPGTVASVELQVRGSSSSDSSGGAPGATLPPNTPFDESDFSVLIWSELGVESRIDPVSNTGFQTVSLDITDITFLGDSITRISLINEGGPNSLADVGQLSVTLIPEPASLSLLGLGSLAALRRRRSA